MKIQQLLQDFISSDAFQPENVYNEFSLQHELGIYLRQKLADTYSVKFERNIIDVIDAAKQLKSQDGKLTNSGIAAKLNPALKKKEIDIVIQCKSNSKEKYAIELKYPKNGHVPEEMYAFIKDIDFTEKLAIHGFTNTYCLTVVDDHRFYDNQLPATKEIYKYFRSSAEIKGEIHKPTGTDDAQKNEYCKIEKGHVIKWHPIKKNEHEYHYYIITG